MQESSNPSSESSGVRASLNEIFWRGTPFEKFTKYGPDSYFVPKFMQEHLAEGICRVLQDRNIYPWMNRKVAYMRYRGNPLRRVKAFLVKAEERNEQGQPLTLPRYGYPGFQWDSALHYHVFSDVPPLDDGVIQEFAHFFKYHNDDMVEGETRSLGVNHVIATLYEDGKDEIGFHSDKAADIAPATPIIILSVGAKREFHLKDIATGSVEVICLAEGDMFVLGPGTNRTMKHAIVPLEEERVLKRTEVGPRISFVMREIKTVYSRSYVERQAQRSQVTRAQHQRKKQEKRAREKQTGSPEALKKKKNNQ